MAGRDSVEDEGEREAFGPMVYWEQVVEDPEVPFGARHLLPGEEQRPSRTDYPYQWMSLRVDQLLG